MAGISGDFPFRFECIGGGNGSNEDGEGLLRRRAAATRPAEAGEAAAV